MADFFSHSQYINNKREGTKLLRQHIKGVRNNALASYYTKNKLELFATDTKELLSDLCKYHDLGKYTQYFQEYLLEGKYENNSLKNHARLGAYVIFNKYHTQNTNLAIFAYHIIRLHHANLSSFDTDRFLHDVDFLELQEVFNEQIISIKAVSEQVIEEINEEGLSEYLLLPNNKSIRKSIRALLKKTENHNIEHYFLINYLFSLLIEADKLDASDTKIYPKVSIPVTLVDDFIGVAEVNPRGFENLEGLGQNELRNYVRASVLENLKQPAIINQKLFTLTAPTGIGKTLTALDFALRLRAIIKEKEEREAQIIYGLPFINIIEQSIKVYNEVLGEKAKVLAHYQYADAVGQQNDKDESVDYHQKVMTLDTWQCDVVITTFVQFLQTLIGNRNKLLKKFNHFAGAVIILDEVQTLRLEYLPLVGAALYYLSKFLDARIILMTATKPKLFELANREILEREGEIANALELLPTYENVFSQFKRTQIIPLIDKQITTEEFVETHFLEKWQPNQSCLIVCNTVNRSIEVYREVVSKVDNPVYYLSTNIVPAQRLYIIERVKLDLRFKKHPILVSTQSVEAGVDLDFDMGFRDLGPIDSIIQVAGRINRNNDPYKRYSPLYVVDFGDCCKIYDAITQTQSSKALKAYSEGIKEEHYLNLISEYYDNISDKDRASFYVSRQFFSSMKRLNYDSELKPGGDGYDYPVSHFKVIEDKGYAVSVFIELDEAVEAKKAFKKLIDKTQAFSKEQFEPFKQTFHQHIIAVPKYLSLIKELEADKSYLTDNILLVKNEEIEKYYDEVTGFIRDKTETQTTAFF